MVTSRLEMTAQPTASLQLHSLLHLAVGCQFASSVHCLADLQPAALELRSARAHRSNKIARVFLQGTACQSLPMLEGFYEYTAVVLSFSAS